MRFCINGRQPYSVIKKADEIKFAYVDKDKIIDLVENYSDKIIILDVPGDESDWTKWKMYDEVFAEFHIALHDLSRAGEFNENNIKWYWPFPITSFYELGMITNLHPSYILLGPPLSFDLKKVKKKAIDENYEPIQEIPLRMVVNSAHPGYLPTNGTHGICGQWVRPEDVDVYGEYIQCFEFEDCKTLKEEEVLLNTYKNKEWPGNLNLLIKKLDFNIDNRVVPEELGAMRMTCGQKCWSGSSCQLCVHAFYFAEKVRKEHFRRKQQAAIDNN